MQHAIANRQLLQERGYRVEQVSIDQPWEWFAKGWNDIKASPGRSLTYGSAIVLLSATITLTMIAGNVTFLVPFLIAGFFLVAPLLAIGLYYTSSRLERGAEVHASELWDLLRRKQGQLGVVTSFLFMIMQGWLLASVVMTLMLFDGLPPTLDNFVPVVFLSGEHFGVLAAVTALGALFAACAFCISAVTVPMVIDRPVDAFTAMRTSFRAVLANPGPMLLWAALIVAIVGAAMLTFYVGLFLAVPLVGHATWHAYRDLVPRGNF